MRIFLFFILGMNNSFGETIPSGRKHVVQDNTGTSCFLVENKASETIFVPDKSSEEVLSLSNKQTDLIEVESCRVFAVAGDSLENAKNLKDPNETFNTSETLHALYYGFGPSMMTCVLRSTAGHPADHCDSPPTNFKYANTLADHSYDSVKNLWYQVKTISTSGLAAGGTAILTKYNPDISPGSLVWAVNAARITLTINP